MKSPTARNGVTDELERLFFDFKHGANGGNEPLWLAVKDGGQTGQKIFIDLIVFFGGQIDVGTDGKICQLHIGLDRIGRIPVHVHEIAGRFPARIASPAGRQCVNSVQPSVFPLSLSSSALAYPAAARLVHVPPSVPTMLGSRSFHSM